MARINCILEHPKYEEYLSKTEAVEKDRKFCKHDYTHAITVARIAQVFLCDQEICDLPRDLVYATALLHDIGRWEEYLTGEDHAIASAVLAEFILSSCGFHPEEISIIQTAIREHRCSPEEPNLSLLGKVLAQADDWARDCRHCSVKSQCHKFSKEMLQLVY